MEKKKEERKSFGEIIKNSIFKPVSSVDENTAILKDAKTTFIFAGVVTICIMIANLLSTMLNTIFAKKYDFWTQKYSWNVSFSNLDSLDYFDLILKHLLQYAIIVLAIAGIYYLATLILKKNTTYVKMLGIVSFAIIPNIILSFVGSVLGIIWSPLDIFISAGAVVYTILILTFALKNVLKVNDVDKLIFYSVILIAILKILEYIVFTSELFG